MKRKTLVLAGMIMVLLALLLGACGSDSSTPIAINPLKGTWYGTLWDSNGVLRTITVTVENNNTTSSVLIDNVPSGDYYTIKKAAGYTGIYSATESAGTRGGFFLDTKGKHLVFVDALFNFSVMQKGATGLPGFSSTDPAGSWSGYEVALDSFFDITETFKSSAMVTYTSTGLDISGSNKYGAIKGDLKGQQDLNFGLYSGTMTSPVPAKAVVILTPDKAFAGGVDCKVGGLFPEDCTFSAWSKQ